MDTSGVGVAGRQNLISFIYKNHSDSQSFLILRFNSTKTLFPEDVITSDGIIRFNTHEGDTNILISSSGLVSEYGSKPS